jgi:undecaprenyl diphosphate synthase
MSDRKIPQHVAIILDGNGRWAKSRKLPRTQGHLEGVKRVDEAIETCIKTGIKVLTIYVFSTENWNRPKNEVSMLIHTLIAVLNRKVKKMHEAGVRLQFIGRRQGVPDQVIKGFEEATQLTKNNSKLTVNVAFNYGGRTEILDGISKVIEDVRSGSLKAEQLSEELFSQYLYTKGLPDPDLLIRTSGEKRISNFLLWQLSYAEFYFTEKYWPDFNEVEFLKAIDDFQNRERRYGGLTAQ